MATNKDMLETDLKLRAVSDLMIQRLRPRLGFPFIGSENTPPGLVNDAFLYGGGKSAAAYFSRSPIVSGKLKHFAAGLHIAIDSDLPIHEERTRDAIDCAAQEFTATGNAATHVARLVFLFDFDTCQRVERDIRRVCFAPIFDQFAGKLVYPNPDDYPLKPEPNDWSPHPEGISLAWEGEYTFHQPVLVSELQTVIQSAFNTPLQLDWPTRLPVQKIDGVECRFSFTSRFH